jgi:hypothetical protein
MSGLRNAFGAFSGIIGSVVLDMLREGELEVRAGYETGVEGRGRVIRVEGRVGQGRGVDGRGG